MTDINRLWEARERERDWRARYRAASPEERARMRAERDAERRMWEQLLARLREPHPPVVLKVPRRRWLVRLYRRFRGWQP